MKKLLLCITAFSIAIVPVYSMKKRTVETVKEENSPKNVNDLEKALFCSSMKNESRVPKKKFPKAYWQELLRKRNGKGIAELLLAYVLEEWANIPGKIFESKILEDGTFKVKIETKNSIKLPDETKKVLEQISDLLSALQGIKGCFVQMKNGVMIFPNFLSCLVWASMHDNKSDSKKENRPKELCDSNDNVSKNLQEESKKDK